MSPPILTPDELASRLKVPKATIYKLTRDGVLPVVKVGRHYRYRLDAIERWELGEEEPGAHVRSLRPVA